MRTWRTFALIEALQERLELLLIQNGTLCVSLPQGCPCLLQPGNLGTADYKRLSREGASRSSCWSQATPLKAVVSGNGYFFMAVTQKMGTALTVNRSPLQHIFQILNLNSVTSPGYCSASGGNSVTQDNTASSPMRNQCWYLAYSKFIK